MYQIISWIVRYVFIALIYYFIYSIIKLIYLDIQAINKQGKRNIDNPYLKLINRKDRLDFNVHEFYDLGEVTTIGRGNKSDIQLADKYISTNHAKITLDEGSYFIEDVGSVNGTYLNNTQIEDVVELKEGDRIGLGQVEFIFVKEVE
ncbi:FHA domain-containing protein [Alkaliphilus pronyensis]|uniref:FHA domain-containing protein n=1 Tax=Alkaliphilus pronyensis TaxID=1482732 RepID=A0A6I0FHA0_9FIRM|nr:FHA domain-containing protein [Alkaliphilus pronyensis]KAB3539722.1 FHA domain-containing protein [Alkaliphilus pronyensis]